MNYQDTEGPQSNNTNVFKYLTPILLAIAILMFLFIYLKKGQGESSLDVEKQEQKQFVNDQVSVEEQKKETTRQALKKTDVNKPSPKKQKTIVLSPSGQPDIKTVSRHAAIAMSYLNRRLPIKSNNTLSTCVSHMQKYEFTEAKHCLTPDFGAVEAHAEWYRALLTLATEGKSKAVPKLSKITSNSSHPYRDQAKALASTIK